MADDTPPDPGAAFREWVTQWERNFDAFANQVMGTEGFSQAMNEAQKAQLNAQRMHTEAMAQYLAGMNMPTREDVLRLGEAIAAVDRRLERMEEKMGLDEAPSSTPIKRPARTKKPPSAQSDEAKATPPRKRQTTRRRTTNKEKSK